MTLMNCGNPGETGRKTCLGNCTLHPPDDKPSIAELQRLMRRPMNQKFWPNESTRANEAAAAVLLEIAAAALRYRAGMIRSEVDTSNCEALDRALAKVRP